MAANQQDSMFDNGKPKLVVLVINQDDERVVFTQMLHDLDVAVKDAVSGGQALELLEDFNVDLLIMDIQQPDMHGWQFLAKVKEIGLLHDLPVIVIAHQPHLGPPVEQVVYMTRPVSIARLRQNIIEILRS
ncbi:MAG: response regulator [Chloroflexota bacterium]